MNLLFGTDQDFHRPQKNPGAYEWWHFDGTDEQSGYDFSIQFHAGNLFSAFYQDSLKTYWEKTKSPLVDPSQHPDAPNPLDYCGVTFRLFHKGSSVVESFQEFSQKSLRASDKHGAVLLGPNRFNWDGRGDPPGYVLTAQAPLRGRKTLRARLFFTPLPLQKPALPQPGIPSTHTWVLAAPLCRVEGTLEWVNQEGERVKEVAFQGRGYHDHHFGTVPLDRFVKAWYWGRAFWEGETLVYSVQIPVGENEKAQTLAWALRPSGNQAVQERLRPSYKKRNFFWVPYHRSWDFHGDASLWIRHARILGDGPVSLVFEDKVQWEPGNKTFLGRGLSNYLYAPRLSSSFFFPFLKAKSLIVRPAPDDTPIPPPEGDVTTTRPTQPPF